MRWPDQLLLKPALCGLPSRLGFGAQSAGFFAAAAGFGGDGFLHGGFRNGNDEVHNVLVGQARMSVAGHHVASLRENEATAENGSKVIGTQSSGNFGAKDMKLRRAAPSAFREIDFIQVRAQAGKEHIIRLKR